MTTLRLIGSFSCLPKCLPCLAFFAGSLLIVFSSSTDCGQTSEPISQMECSKGFTMASATMLRTCALSSRGLGTQASIASLSLGVRWKSRERPCLLLKQTEFEASGNSEKHLEDLLELAKEGVAKGKVVAIGECGLDYDRLQFCPAAIQQRYFEKQFSLSETLNLPMFLHMRAAANDFLSIVERNKHRFVAGVVHSFTGSAEDREQILAIKKLYIGINGCSLKTNENLEVVSEIPAERMMVETDSPYCEIKSTHAGFKNIKTSWPSKKKEKHEEQSLVKGRNEPCCTRQVVEVVAAHRGITDLTSFARTLYENTCRVFFPNDLDSLAGAVISDHYLNKES